MKMILDLEKAFAKQIKAELDSWYAYMNLAACYIDTKLPGHAHWMHKQAEEELFHATKMRDYLITRNNQIFYEPIGIGFQKPSLQSALEGFIKALKYEQLNTENINELSTLCENHKDRGALIFLQWYIAEQEEEESSIQNIIEQLEVAGNSSSALLRIDMQLGHRTSNE